MIEHPRNSKTPGLNEASSAGADFASVSSSRGRTILDVSDDSRGVILFGRHALKSDCDETIGMLSEVERRIAVGRPIYIFLENGHLPRNNSDQQSQTRFLKASEAALKVFPDKRPGALETQIALGNIPPSFIFQYSSIISKATRILPSHPFEISKMPEALDGGTMHRLAQQGKTLEHRHPVRLYFEGIQTESVICDDLGVYADSQASRSLLKGEPGQYLFWRAVDIFAARGSRTFREAGFIKQLLSLTSGSKPPLIFGHYGASHEVGLTNILVNSNNKIIGIRSAIITDQTLDFYRLVLSLKDFEDRSTIAVIAADLIVQAEAHSLSRDGIDEALAAEKAHTITERVAAVAQILARSPDGGRAILEKSITDAKGNLHTLEELLNNFSKSELPPGCFGSLN